MFGRQQPSLSTLLIMAAVTNWSFHLGSQLKRQPQLHEEMELSKHAQIVRDVCGGKFTAEFDHSSFIEAGKMNDIIKPPKDNPPSVICSVPMQAIQQICQNASGRRVIIARINSYQCAFQDGPIQALSLSAGGKLRLGTSYEAFENPLVDSKVFVEDWLKAHLMGPTLDIPLPP